MKTIAPALLLALLLAACGQTGSLVLPEKSAAKTPAEKTAAPVPEAH